MCGEYSHFPRCVTPRKATTGMLLRLVAAAHIKQPKLVVQPFDGGIPAARRKTATEGEGEKAIRSGMGARDAWEKAGVF